MDKVLELNLAKATISDGRKGNDRSQLKYHPVQVMSRKRLRM